MQAEADLGGGALDQLVCNSGNSEGGGTEHHYQAENPKPDRRREHQVICQLCESEQ